MDVSKVRLADLDGGGGAAMSTLWPSGGDVSAKGSLWREQWAPETPRAPRRTPSPWDASM